MSSFKTKRAAVGVAGAQVDLDFDHRVSIRKPRRSIVALRLSLAAPACLLAALLFWSAPALAKEVHVFKSSFGSEGSGPGQFKEPYGVAVNDTTHDVYVVDSGNDRVEIFNSTGTTLLG
ncbi:MAG: hypothetical protein ACRDK7_08020, partial [Solirubrobacteraceae bacterium]